MNLRHILAAAAWLAATSAHAQMPVTDALLNTQTKLAWVKQATDMASQIRAAQNQLNQAKATYDSLTGSRNMAGLLNNPSLYNYLPPDAAAALRANAAGLTSARALAADQKLFGIDQTSLDPKGATATTFAARQAANANVQLLNEQGYQATADRIRQLDALTKSIDGATDPMAINALAVRVQAEQGRIANEQARLNLLANMAANAERVREQQSREIVMQATRGPIPAGW